MANQKKKKLVQVLFFVSILVIIGNTFAWLTGDDQKVNRLDTPNAKLNISIEGKTNNLLIAPGSELTRDIYFQNNGKQSVFVRVSLKEVMAPFTIDLEDKVGNAHLKNFISTNPTTTVDINDSNSWVKGDYYKRATDNINQVEEVLSYPYAEPQTTRPTDLEYIKVDMPNVDTSFSSTKTAYWLYYDGYYYYSDILLPTNPTSIFIHSLTIPSDMPNRLKGSLYNQDIQVEGTIRNRSVFDVWNIPKNSANPVYNLYSKQLN